jgi:2-methylcitrate dehydratase PrpD
MYTHLRYTFQTIFPAAWAATQELGKSGKDFVTASVAGYEVGCRVGELLGKRCVF